MQNALKGVCNAIFIVASSDKCGEFFQLIASIRHGDGATEGSEHAGIGAVVSEDNEDTNVKSGFG